MNKQELANKIWEAANRMRSKIEANEYKDYILGFIFYKFLSEKEEQFFMDNDMDRTSMKTYLREEDEDTVQWAQQEIGYFIAYDHLFSVWLARERDFDIANVRDALSAFSRLIAPNCKRLFEGIFDTLETGLSKLGTTAAQQTKAARDLIHLIGDIPMDNKEGYDVLGYIYEYLIQNFAANAGKKAGEFYTPHEVSALMSEIVAEHHKDKKQLTIYDSCSGSGSLLINIGRAFERHNGSHDNIKYYAQELKQNTYNLTRMNLIMRGILPANIVTRNADTLEDDWPYFDEADPAGTYNLLAVDALVSNPPYSQRWDPEGKDSDPRFAYGLAPRGKADYAFVLCDLYHVNPDGIMCIVLPHGVLFRGGEEGRIRRSLIENNKIDTIIGLPSNIFFGTGIPTIIMVLRQKRQQTDVLIIDASKGFVKEGTDNKLRASDIKRITDTFRYRRDTDKYSRRVSKEEIRQNDYNLNIPRYVDSAEEPESYDIYASMFGGIPKNEVEHLAGYWDILPGLKEDIFEESTEEHLKIRHGMTMQAVEEHPAVVGFKKMIQNRLGGFAPWMFETVSEQIDSANALKIEEEISEHLFEMLREVPLLDHYQVYQLFIDHWKEIEQDIETIQTEGKKVITEVVPNMVTKKKGGKDQEVQEGYRGRILPFELVQNCLLKEQKSQIDRLQQQLSQTEEQIDEYVQSIDEEDWTEEHEEQIKDQKKQLREIKKEIRLQEEKIHADTKTTIESLSPEEAAQMLRNKWAKPISDEIEKLPTQIIQTLIDQIQRIKEKYQVTFDDIEKEINRTEKELAQMLGQLNAPTTDKKGINELIKILEGGKDEEN